MNVSLMGFKQHKGEKINFPFEWELALLPRMQWGTPLTWPVSEARQYIGRWQPVTSLTVQPEYKRLSVVQFSFFLLFRSLGHVEGSYGSEKFQELCTYMSALSDTWWFTRSVLYLLGRGACVWWVAWGYVLRHRQIRSALEAREMWDCLWQVRRAIFIRT